MAASTLSMRKQQFEKWRLIELQCLHRYPFIIINDPGTISISKSFTGMKFIIHKTRGRCVEEVRSRNSAFPFSRLPVAQSRPYRQDLRQAFLTVKQHRGLSTPSSEDPWQRLTTERFPIADKRSKRSLFVLPFALFVLPGFKEFLQRHC